MVGGKEQSSLLQTTFFETFLKARNIFWELSNPSGIWEAAVRLKDDFVAYRRDPDRGKYCM
jgi:hypothetical protein